MRVIAGEFKGRTLHTLPGERSRPTTGKVREAVFSRIQHLVPGSTWLDLCAGHGGMGIEALSRGAKFCWFVDNYPPACRVIARNLALLSLDARAGIICADAGKACRRLTKSCGRCIDCIWIRLPPTMICRCHTQPAFAAGSRRSVDSGTQCDYPAGGIARQAVTRTYGSTVISYFEMGKPMTTAIYPGSFDPVTIEAFGYYSPIGADFSHVRSRCPKYPKKPDFSLEQRRDYLLKVTRDLDNVEVITIDGLLVEAAQKRNARIIIKGLRAMTDFEYEFQMALMNKKLGNDVETLFMATSTKYSFLSSSLVKEVARLGGCIDGLVPEEVREDILAQLRR